MSDPADLLAALKPVLEHLSGLDAGTPGLAEALEAALPLGGESLKPIEALIHEGIEQGWLCPRGEEGVRYGRLCKASDSSHGYSIDAVDMTRPGPGHAHPRGEIDLCFAIEGDPRFDGRAPGWTVYPPGSWHVPTVRDGRMAILYFLPGGEIRFGPRNPN
jgi:hypothetical protein